MVFDFEKHLVGKNIHCVLTFCPKCAEHGISMPLNKECPNCGYLNCFTYYDAETIQNFINELLSVHSK